MDVQFCRGNHWQQLGFEYLAIHPTNQEKSMFLDHFMGCASHFLLQKAQQKLRVNLIPGYCVECQFAFCAASN